MFLVFPTRIFSQVSGARAAHLRTALILLFLLIFPGVSFAERPFQAQSAGDLTGPQLRIDLGVDFTHMNAREDLLAFPAAGVNYATGQLVDVEAYYNFLYRFTRNGTTIYGTGDLTLWTKVRFVSERGNLPGLGLGFGVKLPNANAQSGLGSDQTDFYASALASKKWGRFENRLNLGLALLDDPYKLRGQQDLFTIAAASVFSFSPHWQGLVDFYSQQGSDPQFGLSRIVAGVRYLRKQWVWDLALKKGLGSENKGFRNELSLDWGVVLGASRYFDLGRNH